MQRSEPANDNTARPTIPPTLTVAELSPNDLRTQCPQCRVQYFHLGYNVLLRVREAPRRFPLGDATPVADYVAKHVCRRCSRPGRPVRAIGWIETAPRSGAEGYRQRPTPRPRTPS